MYESFFIEDLLQLRWILVVTTTAVIVTFAFWWKCYRGIPPGPFGLPFLGYVPFLREDTHVQFAELSKLYGDVFSFRIFGGYLVVVVNGQSAAREVFHDRADEFNGRLPVANFLNFFDGGLGIAQSEGTDWKEKRRFFLNAAKNFGFGKSDFEDYIHEFIWKMVDDIRGHTENDRQFDAREEVTFVTGNVIAKIMCDKKFNKDDPTFVNLVRGFGDILGIGLGILYRVGIYFKLSLRFSATARSKMDSLKRVQGIIHDIVAEHVDTFDPYHQRDFIDAYLNQMKSLEQHNQLRNSSFSMDALKSIALNMMLEGTESTGTTVASLIMKLCEHPDVQQKAQLEIDRVVGRSRLPSWKDRSDMPYVDAVILELYRVAVFFNVSTFYSNYEEAYLRGYRIPKRSILVANFWSINNDPQLFPEPEKFNPERFLGPDGKRIKHENPIPFGIGKRMCVGESLAQMEVFLIISALLQSFTLRPGHGYCQVRAEIRDK